jgi:hypothetical protein
MIPRFWKLNIRIRISKITLRNIFICLISSIFQFIPALAITNIGNCRGWNKMEAAQTLPWRLDNR